MRQLTESDFIEGITQTKKAYVYCTGIKKRCRNIARHQLELGHFTPETKCENLKDIAKYTIEKEMKTVQGSRFEISLQNEEIEIENDMKITRFKSSDIFNRERLEVIL